MNSNTETEHFTSLGSKVTGGVVDVDSFNTTLFKQTKVVKNKPLSSMAI